MKLDPQALEEVFKEINDLAQGDSSSAEEGRAIAVGLLETYLKKLGTTNYQTAIINLTNTRSGLLAIIQTCAKAEAVIGSIRTSENNELCSAFIGYIRIIAQQADAHYAGHLN
jgi:hypothetical protein